MAKAGHAALFAVLMFALSGMLTQTYAQNNGLSLIAQNIGDVNCQNILSPFPYYSTDENCPFVTQTQKPVNQKAGRYKRPTISLSVEKAYANHITTKFPTPHPKPPATPQIKTQIAQQPVTIPPTKQILPSTTPIANDNADTIFDLINTHRAEIGKPAFEKNDNLCSLAQIRSTEIPGEIASGSLHSGLYNRNLPYWITEDAKYGSDESGTVNWWLHSPIHRAAIEDNDRYMCVKCTGTYCSALFTNYTPK